MLLVLASCRQIVGVDDRSAAPGVPDAVTDAVPDAVLDAVLDAAPCSAPTGVEASCLGCLTSSCCSELTACD